MSHVTIDEIITIVAKAHGISRETMLQTRDRGNKPGMSLPQQARAFVGLVAMKHTQASMEQVTATMGYSRGGRSRTVLAQHGARLLGLVEVNPHYAALLERIEQGVDAIHEARTDRADFFETAAQIERPRLRPIQPPTPIKEGEANVKWWRSNDAVFRRAFLEAAE
ncbi:MAG: hypothetical protein AB7U76_24955 [Pirellulales bacterium]